MKINFHIPRSPGRTRHSLVLLMLLMALFSTLKVAGQIAMPDVVCVGTTKHYWIAPTTNSTYIWKINGITQPSVTNEIYILWDTPWIPAGSPYTLSVQEKSAAGCYSAVKSGLVFVNASLPVSVSVTASQNPVCSNIPVTFTATPINGGVAPVYQWKVNGGNVGSNSSTYSYIPSNGDVVICILTSDLPCATGNPAISNPVIMVSVPAPVVTFTACFDSITTVNAKPIKLKGGIPLGGTYSGPGVNSITGVFTPSLAGVGTHTITYTFTNAALCSALAQTHIINYPLSSVICGSLFTDIRDNKTYTTIQIGSQCWLSANLNYGQQLNASANQRDNCLEEKYCYNDNPLNCTNQGGLYEWDELMQFDETSAIQGLCPPAWHVPDEPEWNTLFAVFQGNAYAGDSLRTGGTSGFEALLTGARFMNTTWALSTSAFFWSSGSDGPFKAWAHSLNNINHGVSTYPSSRSNAFSVRCIKD